MSHVLMQENDILECEDFSYYETKNFFQFIDHSEGCSVKFTYQEFVDSIINSMCIENEDIDMEYANQLAVNILANSTMSGRAKWLFNMMP